MTQLSTVETGPYLPEPMLNECQLMAAFRLDWLMVTFGLSVPEMMVVPPPTHQPSA